MTETTGFAVGFFLLFLGLFFAGVGLAAAVYGAIGPMIACGIIATGFIVGSLYILGILGD